MNKVSPERYWGVFFGKELLVLAIPVNFHSMLLCRGPFHDEKPHVCYPEDKTNIPKQFPGRLYEAYPWNKIVSRI